MSLADTPEKPGLILEDFPTIYLLDVPELAPEVVTKLKKYVQKGGSLVWFLGPKTKPSFINETLHPAGLFPVPIKGVSTDLLGDFLTEDVRKRLKDWIQKKEGKKEPTEDDYRMAAKKMWLQGFNPGEPKPTIPFGKIIFRDDKHPFVDGEVFGLAHKLLEPSLYYDNLLIGHYYQPHLPKDEWKVPPDEVQEVITMPQVRVTIDDFKQNARWDVPALMDKAIEKAGEVANEQPEFAPHVKELERLKGSGGQIYAALRGNSLAALDRALKLLLEGGPSPVQPNQPSMPKLWRTRRSVALKLRAIEIRDNVRFGDPLVYSRRYKQGEAQGGYTVAVMTTAGTAGTNLERWNEWGNGPAQWTYPNFIRPMQGFLGSQGGGLTRTLEPLKKKEDKRLLDFPKEMYKSAVKVVFTPQELPPAVKEQGTPLPKQEDLAAAELQSEGDKMFLEYAEATRPGVYTFEFDPVKDGMPPEKIAFAFNVNALRESNLARVDHGENRNQGLEGSPRGQATPVLAGRQLRGFQEP